MMKTNYPIVSSFDPEIIRILTASLDDACSEWLHDNHPIVDAQGDLGTRMSVPIVATAQSGIRDQRLLREAALAAAHSTRG